MEKTNSAVVSLTRFYRGNTCIVCLTKIGHVLEYQNTVNVIPWQPYGDHDRSIPEYLECVYTTNV